MVDSNISQLANLILAGKVGNTSFREYLLDHNFELFNDGKTFPDTLVYNLVAEAVDKMHKEGTLVKFYSKATVKRVMNEFKKALRN